MEIEKVQQIVTFLLKYGAVSFCAALLVVIIFPFYLVFQGRKIKSVLFEFVICLSTPVVVVLILEYFFPTK